MEQTQEKINYDEVMQNDAEAIEAFIKNIYVKSVPEPPRPTKDDLSFWKIAGLESSMFVMSAIGAAVLSSIRTGGLFFLLEVALIAAFNLPETLGNTFGATAMIASLFAFEFFILAFGLKRGRELGKLTVSWWGMGTAMLTIVAASIFSSFTIVSLSVEQENAMNLVMAIISAVGSSMVGFFSTENLGFILNNVTAKRNEIITNHQTAFKAWRDEAVETYFASAYNIRHKRSEKIYGNGSKQQVNQPQNQQQEESDFEASVPQKNKKKSKVDIGYDFVKAFYKKSKRLPTNREIETGTGISVGSAFTALSLFIVENEEELVKKQIVSDKQLDKAKSHIGKSNEQPSPEPEPAQTSYQHVIRNLVDIGKVFPSVESVMSETGLDYNQSLKEMLIYVSENQQFVVESGLLTEQQVSDAINQLSQYPS